MTNTEIYSNLVDFLIVKSEQELGFKWVEEFDKWDSSDCSFTKLVAIVLMREYEISDNGVYGTRKDAEEIIRSVYEFLEET